MVIEITRREVLNNLIRFKDNLLEMRGGGGQQRERDQEKKKGGRTYKVMLNKHTGDMRFAQKISALEHHFAPKERHKGKAEDWKEVHIIVEQSASEVHFEVRDAEDHQLKAADLDPLAWRIAKETVDVLNLKAKEIKIHSGEMLPEEETLRDLSSIHLALLKDRIEDLPGWAGSLGRFDAEKVLTRKPIGTYVLREGDEITISASFHLSEVNLLSVHPYIITFVDKEEKISDILLLQTDKGWTFYEDDPNLKDRAYHFHSSPQDLIQSLHHLLKHPL